MQYIDFFPKQHSPEPKEATGKKKMAQAKGKSIYVSWQKKEDIEKMERELYHILGDWPEAPRPRSWEVDGEKPVLYLRGRCGGDNREAYESDIEVMTTLKGYAGSWDMEGDNTYMIFKYNIDKKVWEKFVKKWNKYNTED